MVTLSPEECDSKVSELTDLYWDDLPSTGCVTSDQSYTAGRLKWQQHVKEHGQSSFPSSPAVALRHVTSMYPNIRALISILCTLSVTSCSAERSFSSLKRIKTPFRSSMTTQWFTGLMLLTVHHDIPIDIAAAIDEFSRRLEMVNILNDWLSDHGPITLLHCTLALLLLIWSCVLHVINWGMGMRRALAHAAANKQRLCVHSLPGGCGLSKVGMVCKIFRPR